MLNWQHMAVKKSKKHFVAVPDGVHFHSLSDFHLQILVFLMRHRIARTSHIHMFMACDRDFLQRSMRLLFDLGLVERRREPFIRGQQVIGSRSRIHEPTNLGLQAASEYLQIPEQAVFNPRRTDHALLRTAFLAPLEAACTNNTHHFVNATEIIAERPKSVREQKNPYSWHVFFKKGEHNVVPDKIFALEAPRPNSTFSKRALFFLEIDTAGAGHKSEPIERSNFSQSSLAKKILLYGLTYLRKTHAKQFGVDNFRVLIITRGAKRIENMLEVIKRYSQIHGFPPSLFMLCEHDDFSPDSILSHEWRVYRRRKGEGGVVEGEELQTLID